MTKIQASVISEPYKVSYIDPIYTPNRRLSVICIGAGASGLLLAYKLDRHFDTFDLTIYEKNADIGGTWFENRYPGCACDVPAHCYTWSFEPKTDWSETYASSVEIQKYFKDFASKHNLNRFVKVSHEVIAATWNDKSSMWSVDARNNVNGNVVQRSAHVLINCGGVLNSWQWPTIEGLHKFHGPLLHSANWDERVSLEGKSVGLIGNGSSGIQILPAIQPVVSKLFTFIRSPTWVSPLIGLDQHRRYTEEEKTKFVNNPESHINLRKKIEERINGSYEMFFDQSDKQKSIRSVVESKMKQRLNNPQLQEKLIPSFSVGCRRLTPGVNYLETLSADNVQPVFGEIRRVYEDRIVIDDGTVYPVDVLICATGFDTTFKPRFPLQGRSQKLLSDMWKSEPRAYFGLAVSGFPNYFMTLGPNCPVGNGPVLIAIEKQIEYIMAMLSKIQKERILTFEVSKEAQDELNKHKDIYMEKMIWNENCRSWYKTGHSPGKVTALWPGSTLHFLEAIKEPKYEDWKFTYPTNRFAYLGNGLSTAEKRTGDLSWYVTDRDESFVDPCLKRARL